MISVRLFGSKYNMTGYILMLLFAVAAAKDFDLKVGNSTCVKLSVEGQAELTATDSKGTQVGKKITVKFDDFELVENQTSCEVIKLIYGGAVQVWFQSDAKIPQAVTPIAAFAPDALFPNATTENDTVVFQAKPFGSFSGNQSFVCKSMLEHDFTTATPTELTFDLKAFTEKLQIEFGSYLEKFSDDVDECAQDTPSTTPKASTTVGPTTPLPPVESVNASVSNGNITCIRLVGEMSVAINSTHFLNVPSAAVASGNCSLNATTQVLELSFEKDWMLRFTFVKNKDSDVAITQIDLTYDTSVFDSAIEATETVSVKDKSLLKSSADGYYMCNANTTLLGVNKVTLTASNLKYRAFNTDKEADLSGGTVCVVTVPPTVTECPADEETSSVVPIAVGAALAGLVVIVLIAYLIGRRRSRATGYESV